MASGIDDTTVLVTGASGFIATHVVQQLQQAGYKVRGTVRSLDNEQKIKPLRELCPGAKHEVELVEADLTSPDGWQEAIRGCTYVIHTASPFPASTPKHESELIKPAVEGTLTVLRACVGVVKKVILTSSVVAVDGGVGGVEQEGELDESNWTNTEKIESAYSKSKTLAERAAWDFVANLRDTDKFELAVMNPGYVMGPILCGGWATSMELSKKLLERDIPALPHINLVIVDVRDVAAAHVAAMTLPNASGKRHILTGTNMWFQEVAKIYSEEFYPMGYNVPVRVAPYFLLKLVSFFDKTIRMIMPMWGVHTKYNNNRMISVLGIEPRPIKDTVLDMAYSMIERGLIKKTEKYSDLKESKGRVYQDLKSKI